MTFADAFKFWIAGKVAHAAVALAVLAVFVLVAVVVVYGGALMDHIKRKRSFRKGRGNP